MRTYRPLLIALAVIAALVVVVLLAGRREAERPDEGGREPTPAPTPIPVELSLYFPGADDLLHREVRQVSRVSAGTTACVRLVLDELKSGSRDGWASPFTWPVAVATIFVRADGTVFVDFSSPPEGSVEGVSTELALVYATANTVVENCPLATRVQLLFGGREVPTLGHLDLSRPLAPRFDLVAQ